MLTRTDIETNMLPVPDSPPVRWRISEGLVPYEQAIEEMEREVAAIANGEADELVWLLEHPPLYTAGTSADVADLIEPGVFRSSPPVAAANIPITGRDSASFTSCST